MKLQYRFLLIFFIVSKITISQNSTITFSVTTPLCNGDCNGSIYTTISGGTAPYTYLWNTGAATNSLSSVCAGIYTLNITDANAVVTTSIVSLTQPYALILYDGYCGSPCYATNSGTFCLSLFGGTPPVVYTYNGQTYMDYLCLGNVPAGIQSYTVTDANGCQLADTTLLVSHPQTTGILTYTAPSCQTCCDAIIEIIPTVSNNGLHFDLLGGSHWYSNGNNPLFTNVCPDTYSVIISSSYGNSNCSTTYTIFIDALSTGVEKLEKGMDFRIYPNPANSILNIIDEQNQFKNATIEIKNMLGEIVLSKVYSSQIDVSELAKGIYFLKLNNRTYKFIKE